MSKTNFQRFMIGTLFSLIGLLMISGYLKIQPVTKSTSFESEPVQLSGFDPNEIGEGEVPRKVIVPSLDIYLDVRSAELINGYWEVFEDTAGWGEGSGIPGQAGNQVVFAHARDGLFAPLKNVEKDMEILILTDNEWYEYKVSAIDEVYPGNTEYIEQSENEVLTLYTCSGFQDSKRLIVRAERV